MKDFLTGFVLGFAGWRASPLAFRLAATVSKAGIVDTDGIRGWAEAISGWLLIILGVSMIVLGPVIFWVVLPMRDMARRRKQAKETLPGSI